MRGIAIFWKATPHSQLRRWSIAAVPLLLATQNAAFMSVHAKGPTSLSRRKKTRRSFVNRRNRLMQNTLHVG
jgi:hypothetical protein